MCFYSKLSMSAWWCFNCKRLKASRDLVLTFLETPALSNIPQHLDFDKKNLTAKVLGIIDREWVALKLNELFVIEFYSRKI